MYVVAASVWNSLAVKCAGLPYKSNLVKASCNLACNLAVLLSPNKDPLSVVNLFAISVVLEILPYSS